MDTHSYPVAVVEELAKILHESGRAAVEQRKIYRDDLPVKPFAEWADLHETAREGRRLMAVFLLDHAPAVRECLESGAHAH